MVPKNKVCMIIENAVQLTLQQLQILSHMDRNLIHFVKAKIHPSSQICEIKTTKCKNDSNIST
jgi:hypothetical protein